jgi:hypothetical protein
MADDASLRRLLIPIGWEGEEPIMAAIAFSRPLRKGLLQELARFLMTLEDMADEWKSEEKGDD